MNLIEEVKKKKEFSGLPDSVILRALEESEDDVKEARKLLRKYFGVFLTNRVLKGKGDLLEVHVSSKKRDYSEFYSRIFSEIKFDSMQNSGVLRPAEFRMEKNDKSEVVKNRGLKIKSVIDLGCGANGFSYEFLRDVVGDVSYVGVEAAGQLVDKMNSFFEKNSFNAKAVCVDLFDIERVLEILRKARKPRVVFLFQVVDALENMKRDFSKEFISKIMEECEVLVISLPLVSLGGGKKFAVKRKWLTDFLEERFLVKRDFEMFGERILVVGER